MLHYDITGNQIDGARSYQEDAFLITNLGDNRENQQVLIIVADGMGGHAAGNVASNMAIQAFNKHVSSNCPISNPTLIPDILRTGINKSNDALYETIKETPALTGMGCTIVAALLTDGKLWWSSVGDSHLYIIRKNTFTKLNADHSYGGFLKQMADEGQPVQENPSISHNMLMSALTGSEIAKIDTPVEPFILQPNDDLIICSDGLDTLTQKDIAEQVGWSPDANKVTAALLKAVTDAENPRQDNTTVVSVRVKEIEELKDSTQPDPTDHTDDIKKKAGDTTANDAGYKKKSHKAGIGNIVVAMVALAIIIGSAIFFLTQYKKNEPVIPISTMTKETITEAESAAEEVEIEVTKKPEPQKTVTSTKPVRKRTNAIKPFTDKISGNLRGPVMLTIPAGEFIMGSTSLWSNINERPKHKVSLPEFAISQYEITYMQYEIFAKATGKPLPRRLDVAPGNYPVAQVSWQDAQDYVAWLSRKTGKQYRLPTEAQWEYAARAGTTSSFWWGEDIGDGHAHCLGCNDSTPTRKSVPIGSFPANPWGLHDTTGNVSEWTLDCFNKNYQGAPTDGSAWQNGDCSKRIVRGGSFSNAGNNSTNTRREKYPAGSKLSHIGFRIVRKK